MHEETALIYKVTRGFDIDDGGGMNAADERKLEAIRENGGVLFYEHNGAQVVLVSNGCRYSRFEVNIAPGSSTASEFRQQLIDTLAFDRCAELAAKAKLVWERPTDQTEHKS